MAEDEVDKLVNLLVKDKELSKSEGVNLKKEIIDSLLPLVSPMEASACALHEMYGDDLKIVFIGPCIAKKGEAAGTKGKGRVDAALTFRELRHLLKQQEIGGATIESSSFDPPYAGLGAVFPLSRGLVQTIGLERLQCTF